MGCSKGTPSKYKLLSFSIILIISSLTLNAKAESGKTVYTENEVAAIAKLRKVAADLISEDEYYQKDHFLLRFLRARNLNVEAAHEMMQKAYNWRKENNIDNILNETLLDFSSPPYKFEGMDNEGRPLVLFTPTMIDLRKLVLSGKRDLALRNWDQLLEEGYWTLRNITRRDPNGEEITQFVGILDFTGFSLRQHFCLQCAPVYAGMIYHYENYYPGAMKYFIAINVNRIALPLVEFMRPFMSPATQKAFKVFGPHKPEWSAFIRSIIPADQLPFRFGGTKPDH